MARKKTAGQARAERSGFAPKLRAWLRANREAWEERRVEAGPRNIAQLAAALTEAGETANESTVRAWASAPPRCLPEARFIALLERIIGAPFAYLDDAKTPWPPPPSLERLWALVLIGAPKDLDRAAAVLADAAAILSRGRAP